MADGALDAGGGGVVALGDLRVQALGDGVDVLVVADGEQDGVAQELVALDVRGHADLVQDLGDGQFVAVLGERLRARRAAGRLEHAADEHRLVKRLDEKEGKAVVEQLLLDFLALERAGHKKCRARAGGVLRLIALLDRDGVQVRHEGVEQRRLRVLLQQSAQGLGAVFLAHRHLHALGLQRLAAQGRDLCAGIGHQELDLLHCDTLLVAKYSFVRLAA